MVVFMKQVIQLYSEIARKHTHLKSGGAFDRAFERLATQNQFFSVRRPTRDPSRKNHAVFFDNCAYFEYSPGVSRISIEVTPEQHRRLKAVAALSGQSIKDYILSQSIPQEGAGPENPLQPLESFLQQRISQAASGGISERSVSEIWAEVQSKQA